MSKFPQGYILAAECKPNVSTIIDCKVITLEPDRQVVKVPDGGEPTGFTPNKKQTNRSLSTEDQAPTLNMNYNPSRTMCSNALEQGRIKVSETGLKCDQDLAQHVCDVFMRAAR